MSTFFERHRAIGDAADDPILVDDDDDEPKPPEMFGDAIPSLRKIKNLNDELMDLISHAKQLSIEGYMERKEIVVFKLFTLWRATRAMSIETRTEMLQDARSYLFKDDSESVDEDKKRKREPIYKNVLAKRVNNVLEEMIEVIESGEDKDFDYDDIISRFYF